MTESTKRLLAVDIPMRCIATLDPETMRVVRVSFLPREGDAGYFGPGADLEGVVVDGDYVDSRDGDAEDAAAVWEADWSILANLGDGIEWEG